MKLRITALGLAILGALTQSADALTFSFTTISGDTLSTDQASAFQTAANAWSTALSDPFTVSMQIGFRSLAANVLGGSSPALVEVNANVVKAHLAADSKSANDAIAVSSLPTYGASDTLVLTNAQASAIGIAVDPNDGTIEFSSNYTYSTSRSAQGTIAPGTFDLVGIAEHEIGHTLGFLSSFDNPGTPATILDQFRYLGAGMRDTTLVPGAYFSLNGGMTKIAGFSPGQNDSYQASHWLEGTGALLDPAVSAGVVQNIAALDLLALDVIGYDLATPVGEPASLAMLAMGLLGVAAYRRYAAR